MTPHDAIVNVLTTIEPRKNELLTIERLSYETYLSESHLQKLFRLTTGQSLMSYARGKRQMLCIREKISPGSLFEAGQGVLCSPQNVLLPSFYIVGRPHHFKDFDDDRDALKPSELTKRFLEEDIFRIPNAVSEHVYLGYVTVMENSNDTIYTPSIQVKDMSKIPPGLFGKAVEHNRYS